MIPITAPFAAVFGLGWYKAHRDEFASLPALYAALSRLAIGIGLGQSAVMMFMTVFFRFIRAG